MPDWEELHARARERYEDGEARLPDDPDQRQRQLTRMGNAAGAAGLTALMAGRDGGEWFARAAERYRESWEHAPPESWGRPIGAIKSRILAGDWDGAADDARWALEVGAAESDSPIGRYAAALAFATLGDWDDVRPHADVARTHDDLPERGRRRARVHRGGGRGRLRRGGRGACSSRSRRATRISRTSRSRTPCSCSRRSPARRGMAAELESELLP